jgi:hypothetical protein
MFKGGIDVEVGRNERLELDRALLEPFPECAIGLDVLRLQANARFLQCKPPDPVEVDPPRHRRGKPEQQVVVERGDLGAPVLRGRRLWGGGELDGERRSCG